MTFNAYCLRYYKIPENAMYYTKKVKAYKAWQEQIKNSIPTEYDILACLEIYIPDTFDDFCDEFGYDNDSISALNTYLACQRQWAALRKIFTKEQIEKLSEIR